MVWPVLWFCPCRSIYVPTLCTRIATDIWHDHGRSKRNCTSLDNSIWTLRELLKGIEIGFAGSAVAAVALLVFGTGFWTLSRQGTVLVQLMVLPALLCTVVVLGVGHHLWPRFYFFAFGFAALVSICGTMQLGQWAGRIFGLNMSARNFVGTALCGALILLSAISIPAVYGPKQDFEGALRFIEEVKSADDAVVTLGGTIFPYARLYKTDWESTRSLEMLNMIRSNVRRTWLLYTMPVHLEAKSPEIMRVVNREFEIVKEFYGTLGGGSIFVCRFIKSP